MVSALAVKGLSHRYAGRDVPALDELGFEVASGRMVFVLGPNGSGKSTLFRILLRLLRADRGTVSVMGQDLRGFTAAQLAAVVSYIPQDKEVTFNYRVRHTVVLGRIARRGIRASPGDADWVAADAALAAVGISEFAERGIQELSGGEWQLVMIARALCQGGKLLILDEPTSALDAGNQIKVLTTLRRLVGRDGVTVLLSSHQPNHAFEFADDVLLLKRGTSVGVRPVGELTGEQLSDLYDLPMRVVSLPDIPGLRLCVTEPEGES